MLGEFVLPHGGSVWTSTIVDGLARLDITERNARQAAARLSDQGLIASERVGRSARWTLTEEGRRLLEEGSDRIDRFAIEPLAWSHRWLVVLASVPEDERAKRHQLRSRLGFAGFGFLGPGVAVSPHIDREANANAILRELDLDGTAIVFIGETGSLVPDAEIMRRAWDLAELAERYRMFTQDAERSAPASDGDSFAAVIELVHEWRRFPFDDPEIPDELLPGDWPGTSAKELFDDRRVRWAPAAIDWFISAERAGDRSGGLTV